MQSCSVCDLTHRTNRFLSGEITASSPLTPLPQIYHLPASTRHNPTVAKEQKAHNSNSRRLAWQEAWAQILVFRFTEAPESDSFWSAQTHRADDESSSGFFCWTKPNLLHNFHLVHNYKKTRKTINWSSFRWEKVKDYQVESYNKLKHCNIYSLFSCSISLGQILTICCWRQKLWEEIKRRAAHFLNIVPTTELHLISRLKSNLYWLKTYFFLTLV